MDESGGNMPLISSLERSESDGEILLYQWAFCEAMAIKNPLIPSDLKIMMKIKFPSALKKQPSLFIG
jgi:hypothetical protein